MVPRLREIFMQGLAEVASNSRNKIQRTWEPLFSPPPCTSAGYKFVPLPSTTRSRLAIPSQNQKVLITQHVFFAGGRLPAGGYVHVALQQQQQPSPRDGATGPRPLHRRRTHLHPRVLPHGGQQTGAQFNRHLVLRVGFRGK